MNDQANEKAPRGAGPLECGGSFSIGVERDKGGEPLFVASDLVIAVDHLEDMLIEFRIRGLGAEWRKSYRARIMGKAGPPDLHTTGGQAVTDQAGLPLEARLLLEGAPSISLAEVFAAFRAWSKDPRTR